MNKKVRDLWAKDLEESGALQGIGYLRTGDPERGDLWWCCLGRLCELHRTETGQGEWRDSGEKTYQGRPIWRYVALCVRETGSQAFLPEQVRAWAGLARRVDDPTLQPETRTRRRQKASEVNDAEVPFTEIAKLVREYEGEPAKKAEEDERD